MNSNKKYLVKIIALLTIVILIFFFRPVMNAVFKCFNPPFNKENAKKIANTLNGKNILFFNPARYENGIVEINDESICMKNLKKEDYLYINRQDSISKKEIKELSKQMKKLGLLYFEGDDTSYFFNTGGFLDDAYGYFYLKIEIDSIKVREVALKHEVYNYQNMQGESKWYEFGTVLPKYK